MPCIAALIVLGIMGIFSASHRKLAREALDCVLRRVTLKPCDTGFDIKVKSTILGRVMKKSPRLAKLISKYFDWLAFLVVGITLVASIYSLWGLYNYYAWGNCGGQTSSSFCVFDPTGANTKSSTLLTECSVDPQSVDDLVKSSLNLNQYISLNQESDQEIVMMGCFSCQYTRKVYPMIKSLVDELKPRFTMIHFPVHQETTYLSGYDYCIRQSQPDNYYQFIDLMFNQDIETISQEQKVISLLQENGFDTTSLQSCIATDSTKAAVEQELQQAKKTGIFGTPTIFVNDTPVVGPKPERVYKRLLQNSWF